MFSQFMVNAWEASTIVAVVAGVVGFFTVLRGSSFAAHALPNGAFAGAAGASLLGVNTILGLGVFSLLGAIGIAGLGRRQRHDVATALAIVVMLGIGALFLAMTTEYAPEIFSLLFGEVLGVSSSELVPTAVIGAVCVAAIVLLYRPLLLSSVMPDAAESRGVDTHRMELAFLLVVALVTTMAVPVVGTLLIFSLLISPAATARSFTNKPLTALGLSVVIALATVWSAIALSYTSNLPIGFFVGTIGAVTYTIGRGWTAWRHVWRSSPGTSPSGSSRRALVAASGRRTGNAEGGKI
ncbi:MAG TPA: metal ABC transporter permease [Acidimicrobiales bacterium]|nr:metal ABC transporter permease [Acidimicrobiales bacterium]